MHLAKIADSVDAAALPDGLPAYAGYVDGEWPSFNAICRRFHAHAHCVSLTVLGGNARFADVERGDLTVLEGAAWLADRVPVRSGGFWTPQAALRRRISAQWRPGLYLPESALREVQLALDAIAPGLFRTAYCIWVARWTQTAPTALPTGVDAVQYASDASGNYDLSEYGPRFLREDPPPTGSAS